MRPLLQAADWLRHLARLRQSNPAHAWGRRGEDLAHRYLRRKDFIVVGRNFRVRGAGVELDLIAREGDAVVFVEVKTRGSAAYGLPEDAVDHDKQHNMRRAALAYMRRARLPESSARFDIVSILLENPPKITHQPDAFSLNA